MDQNRINLVEGEKGNHEGKQVFVVVTPSKNCSSIRNERTPRLFVKDLDNHSKTVHNRGNHMRLREYTLT